MTFSVRPNGEIVSMGHVGDVVALLRTREALEVGVEEAVFHRNGLLIEAVAAGLRARGYEVEVIGGGKARRLRLLATPGQVAKRHAEDQGALFEEETAPTSTYKDAV